MVKLVWPIYPWETKLNKYFLLALSLAQLPAASQKQWQVACGGLVYFSMFHRPILGSLNQVWRHTQDYEDCGRRVLPTPPDCKLELLGFLGLLPLARMDFRLDMRPQVSCRSGAASAPHTTPIGAMVAQGGLRGQWAGPGPEVGVLAIGLFDGIGGLIVGYVSVEKREAARRVVESHFPG